MHRYPYLEYTILLDERTLARLGNFHFLLHSFKTQLRKRLSAHNTLTLKFLDLTIEVHIYLKNDYITGVTSRIEGTSVKVQPRRNRSGVKELFDNTYQKSPKGEPMRYLNSRTPSLWAGHSKPTLNALVVWRSTPSQSRIRNGHMYKAGSWRHQCNDGYYDARRSKVLVSLQP